MCQTICNRIRLYRRARLAGIQLNFQSGVQQCGAPARMRPALLTSTNRRDLPKWEG